MPNIKQKIKGINTIKVFDKSSIVADKVRIHSTKVKDNANNQSEQNTYDYGNRKIKQYTEQTESTSLHTYNRVGKKATIKSKENIKNTAKNIKTFRAKSKLRKQNIKELNSALLGAKKAKKVYISKSINKYVKSSKKTTRTLKRVFRAVVRSVKAIISGLKSLITILVSGGWIAFIVIIIICLIGLLCSSIYGIFFSGEDNGSDMKVSDVVSELNIELADKIESEKDNYEYYDYKIDLDRAEWKDILSVYVVKITNDNKDIEVMTMDDSKKEVLKDIFWDMTSISSSIKNEQVLNEETNEEEYQDILYISITGKTVEEMSREYHFTEKQKEQLEELLSTDYKDLWASAIYGTSIGSPNIVQIALSQVGNIGGEPYWSWYGFNHRVEWCAVFVSWVANEAGYIESNVIPKFVACLTGVNWFKSMGQWQEKGYIPKEGDIIFFDWEVDGEVNHVGIVEKVENNKVYTIEGNSTDDMCRHLNYDINSKYIFGYGTPAY